MDMLDSAIESAFATFDGKDLYPSKEEKAAAIGYGLISDHALIDGNKRIGMYIMLTFLEVNGITLSLSDDDIVSAGLSVASGKMDRNDLLKWITDHE